MPKPEFDSLCAATLARSEALRKSITELEERNDNNEFELKKILGRITEEKNIYTKKESGLTRLRDEEQSVGNMLKGYEIRVKSRERAADCAEKIRKAQMEQQCAEIQDFTAISHGKGL